jgi:hypothetical protein
MSLMLFYFNSYNYLKYIKKISKIFFKIILIILFSTDFIKSMKNKLFKYLF